MRTAIVGAGKGCRSLLEFILERGLVELRLDVRLVCDVRGHAPGILYAADHGIRTCSRIEEVLRMPGLDLIVELTGDDRTTGEIYHRLPAGVRMMDHTLARVFWDLIQLERNLRAEQKHAQAILDSMPDIVMVMDRDMRIKTVNAGFTAYTGLTRSQAYGHFCHEALCHAEEPQVDACPMREVLRTGKRVSTIQVRECAPGIEDHFEITVTPLKGEGGEIRQVVEALHPINERMRLKREVEHAAEQFRDFIDSAHDFISIKDLDGRYEVVNQATAALFDKLPEDCVGRTVHELYPEDIAVLVSSHDREVLAKGEAITYEETLNIGEREVHLGTLRFPLRDYHGDLTGVCTISRDITREKRLQRQLLQADKFAAVGKLAAGVAHEINNPLTGILAFAEDMLEDAGDNENLAEDCKVIIRETLRCRDIVKNLLDFARQTEPHFRRADLNEVVMNTLALVGRLTTFKNVGLRRSLAEDLPPVPGDPHQLQQVVLNLLVNAAEGMSSRGTGGVIELSTSLSGDGRHCVVSVSDDGPGIPEDAIGRIFEPFFSTKKSTHGLGLAVSWRIAERHGGSIEAENNDDRGATFRFILPVWRTDDE